MPLLRTLAAVLLVLLVAEGGARLLAPRLPEPTTWSSPFAQTKYNQLLDVEDQGGADVLLVGSSLVNANIDAAALGEELGSSVYNAGLPGAWIGIWDQYMRDVALDLACPRLVIIGIGPRDANGNEPRIERFVERYREARGRRAAVDDLEMLGRVQVTAESVSAFLRLRPFLRQPRHVFDWLRGGDPPGWDDVIELDERGRYLGFAEQVYNDGRAERQVELLEGPFVDYDPGGLPFKALGRAVAAARAAGATVAIVDLPAVESTLVDALDDGGDDLETYRRRLDRFTRTHDVPLLLIPEMVDHTEYFADLYHTNDAGADRLTRRIADWVESGEVPMGAGCGR